MTHQTLEPAGAADAVKRSAGARSVKAHLVGGGIGSLAATAFMIRDGNVVGSDMTIYEALPVLGGSLDCGGNTEDGYMLRGGRMLTTDNYECTWDLGIGREIPPIQRHDKSIKVQFDAFVKAFK